MFVSPTYEEIKILKEKTALYNSALDNAKALENERNMLTAKYNALLPENVQKLQKLLPDNVDNIRLILEIEKIAQPHGMSIKNVQFDSEATTKKSGNTIPGGVEGDSARQEYGVWNFRFSTQSTYNNFLNFIRDLESNLRIVDISSVKFITNEGGMNPNLDTAYKYDFSIKTYWLKN